MVSIRSMINFKLKDVAQLRGYKNAKHLADALSKRYKTKISYRTIYPLWDNTAENYSRRTLNRLCMFLGVSPGLLIEFVPDEGEQGEETPAQIKESRPKARGPKSKTPKTSAVAAVV